MTSDVTFFRYLVAGITAAMVLVTSWRIAKRCLTRRQRLREIARERRTMAYRLRAMANRMIVEMAYNCEPSEFLDPMDEALLGSLIKEYRSYSR